MAVALFLAGQSAGPSREAGFLPVPASLGEHVEALVWSRFGASEAPCTTRLMPHGGLLLVVGTARRDGPVGSPPVTHVGLRRLTSGQATLQTKPEGCLTLFALLTPAGALGLMQHARLGDTDDERWTLGALVGQVEERRLVVAIERASTAQARLGALAAWLEQHFAVAAGRPEARFTQALNLLHGQPGLSLAELEQEAGIGRRNFERKLRAWLGTSPQQQQRFARVQHAARLGWQRQRLVDVALASGFADQAHFSRTVNAMTGMTAGSFVKRMDTPLAMAFRNAMSGGNLMPCAFESTAMTQAA
jgi:AraC-like DNA-binding protein